jgi:hypothetical protein
MPILPPFGFAKPWVLIITAAMAPGGHEARDFVLTCHNKACVDEVIGSPELAESEAVARLRVFKPGEYGGMRDSKTAFPAVIDIERQ